MNPKPPKKERLKWPLQRLERMYFAMHCWKCKKFELPREEYEKRCVEKIQKIIDSLKVKEMKFRDFNEIIKNSIFCEFEKRDFNDDCLICKKFGIKPFRC